MKREAYINTHIFCNHLIPAKIPIRPGYIFTYFVMFHPSHSLPPLCWQDVPTPSHCVKTCFFCAIPLFNLSEGRSHMHRHSSVYHSSWTLPLLGPILLLPPPSQNLPIRGRKSGLQMGVLLAQIHTPSLPPWAISDASTCTHCCLSTNRPPGDNYHIPLPVRFQPYRD